MHVFQHFGPCSWHYVCWAVVQIRERVLTSFPRESSQSPPKDGGHETDNRRIHLALALTSNESNNK